MTLRRFDLFAELDGDMPYAEERESPDGEWVRWSDVEALRLCACGDSMELQWVCETCGHRESQ